MLGLEGREYFCQVQVKQPASQTMGGEAQDTREQMNYLANTEALRRGEGEVGESVAPGLAPG